MLPVITYGELVYARGQLAELAGLLLVMALPPHAGEFYGSVRAALAAEGQVIGNDDLWMTRTPKRRLSFSSPTANASSAASRDWRSRTGLAEVAAPRTQKSDRSKGKACVVS